MVNCHVVIFSVCVIFSPISELDYKLYTGHVSVITTQVIEISNQQRVATLALVSQITISRSHATLCDIKNMVVDCSGRSFNSIPQEITANVDLESILKLDLSNNPVDTIPEGSFRAFSKVEEIVITNSGLSVIENGAFEGLQQLLTLNLSDNNLSELKSEIFKTNSNLQFLILSNNKLESWDDFDVSDFVSLQYLDISNNQFTYLPSNILKTLEEHPTFAIVLDDNPWDCSNEELLSKPSLAEALCGIPSDVRNDVVVEVSTEGSSANNDTIGAFIPTTESAAANICIVKSFRRNLLPIWLALAIVAGIIIGNGDRIYSWLKHKCHRKYTTRSTSKYIVLCTLSLWLTISFLGRPDEETALK